MFRYGFNFRLLCVQLFFCAVAYFSFTQGWWYFSVVFVGFAVLATIILNHANADSGSDSDWVYQESSHIEVEPTRHVIYRIAKTDLNAGEPVWIESDGRVSGYWSTDEALAEDEIKRIQSAISKLQDTIEIGIKSDGEMMDELKQEKAHQLFGVEPRYKPQLPETIESFISSLTYECPDGFHSSLAQMGISRCKYCDSDIDIE